VRSHAYFNLLLLVVVVIAAAAAEAIEVLVLLPWAMLDT